MKETETIVDLKTLKIEKFASIALGFTHAGTILTTVAIIEFMLQVFLFERMRTIGSGLRDKLFDGNGPLSTFSAKIDIAYAFNFIDKKKPLNTFMELFREVTAALEVEKKDD